MYVDYGCHLHGTVSFVQSQLVDGDGWCGQNHSFDWLIIRGHTTKPGVVAWRQHVEFF